MQNYIQAMNDAIEALKKLPVSTGLLNKTHKLIMQGVRGKDKQPGEFRHSQNWIGGASINDAVFIPPHYEDLPKLITDLEKFVNNDDVPAPHLIKIAIAHYQFETIHPYLDGNGRVGRLLITLYLVSKGILTKPTLYLSDFFEKNKTLYYDNLTRVRANNDLTQWILFFLEGVRETSENSVQTFRSIIKLKESCEHKIISLGKKSKTAQDFLKILYRRPIVDIPGLEKKLSINRTGASRLVDDFMRLGIFE